VSQNSFEVLETKEQDEVFLQTEVQLVPSSTDTSSNQSNLKLPNIVLNNINDFVTPNLIKN